jgi:hypothetical protein
MKVAIALTTAMALVLMTAPASDAGDQDQAMMPPGMKGNFETVEATVLKVFTAEDNDARFRAYLIRWKDFDVIVEDLLGTTDKKEGDSITALAQRLEIEGGGKKFKMLHFMVARPFGN